MAAAVSSSSVALIGASHLQYSKLVSLKANQRLSCPSKYASQKRNNQFGHMKLAKTMTVRASFNEGSRGGGGGGEFFTGFLIGGAVFGTLGYVFASQIRKSLLNEDADGFSRAQRPAYYDEGLETTRQTLNAKISQLNSAIDNVASLLRGGKNEDIEPIEADTETEAAF